MDFFPFLFMQIIKTRFGKKKFLAKFPLENGRPEESERGKKAKNASNEKILFFGKIFLSLSRVLI